MDEVAKTTAGTPMVVTVEPAEQTAAAIDEPVSEPVVAADESVAAANEPMEGTVAADEPTVREGVVAPTRLISPEKGDGPEREGGPPERGAWGEALESKHPEDQLRATWDPWYHKRQKEMPPVWMPFASSCERTWSKEKEETRESTVPLGV